MVKSGVELNLNQQAINSYPFMKTKFTALLIGLASAFAAAAQTNATASDTTNATSVPPVAVAADTNAVVATVPTSTNAPTVADSQSASTNAPAVSVGIPQIKFSDVPITTAIENLARLAGINYMMDPKIGYGLPDANGQVKTEPVLSIRWENITAENALQALLENYGLQMVNDKHTGIARVTLKDPTAPPPLFTKVVQLKYAGVSNMVESVQSVLTDKRSKVLTDTRTSQLVVVATDPEQQAVDALVSQLDKPTRQVLIETRLVEINSNPKSKKGVDWTGTLQEQHVTFGNGIGSGTWTTTFPGTSGGNNGGGGTLDGSGSGNSQNGSIVNQIGGGGFSWNTKNGLSPAIGFLSADGLSAVLSFLNSSADAQVVSTPRVVTLDNEMANIAVTRTYPIFQVSAGSANAAGGSSVNYSNVGTTLKVTPRISANDYIWLHVQPEVSSFFGNFQQQVGGGQGNTSLTLSAPVFDSRSVETKVLVPNSNTLVIGGLVKDNPRAGYTKVPVLGDIHALGLLFRSEDKEIDKDNLLIFITPTIVKDSDFQTSHSGEFLKSKPITMKSPMNPNGFWESPVRTGNWSDPVTDAAK
jgi:type II secretory pathway component GspD/PulD (secretin)